jgi:hypothetical protein
MERKEGKAVTGEVRQDTDFADHIGSGTSATAFVPRSDASGPSRLWHDCMKRWIGGSARSQSSDLAIDLGVTGARRASVAPRSLAT